MTEHYTRNTEEVLAWCDKCSRNTQHRVDSGRRGPCLECKRPSRAKIPPMPRPKEEQLDLFTPDPQKGGSK